MTSTAADTRRSPAATRRPLNLTLLLRRLHGWIGLVIAPSLLLFAVSGGLQVFRLNEARGAYKPPAVFVALGTLHKAQVLPSARPPRGPEGGPRGDRPEGAREAGRDAGLGAGRGPATRGEREPDRGGRTDGPFADARGGAGDRAAGAEGQGGERFGGRRPFRPPTPATLALRWFAVFVSVGLFASTALGVWMSLQDRLRLRLHLALLAVGVLVPLALLLA